MMGVAISSVSLGFLTFFWSFVCVIFNNVGAHARAGELLIALSILTGIFQNVINLAFQIQLTKF